jgi:hypothetical protein
MRASASPLCRASGATPGNTRSSFEGMCFLIGWTSIIVLSQRARPADLSTSPTHPMAGSDTDLVERHGATLGVVLGAVTRRPTRGISHQAVPGRHPEAFRAAAPRLAGHQTPTFSERDPRCEDGLPRQ